MATQNSAGDPQVREALAAAAKRLRYVAKVYSMLYAHRPDEQTINFREYLISLCRDLGELHGDDRIKLIVEGDELRFDAPRAIDLALIAGEAVANAVKYAFPEGRRGTVQVACRRQGEQATLSVADDGVGLPALRREGSFGLRLIDTLSRGMGGTLSIESVGGTRVAVTFPI